MSDLYTDDDVRAMAAAIDLHVPNTFASHAAVDKAATALLDAVVPVVVARALRESADAVMRNERPCNVKRSCHMADSITLRERADQIERKP